MGGWLVDQYDYGATFFATALVQACAVLVWLSLAPLVSNKELRAATGETAPASSSASSGDGSSSNSEETRSPLIPPVTNEAEKPLDSMAIAESVSE